MRDNRPQITDNRRLIAVLFCYLLSAVCCLGQAVFVTNERSGNVSVIRDNRVIATFPAGTRPRGIVLSPDHKRLYVASSHFKGVFTRERDAVRVFDAATFKEIARWPCGTDPEGIATDGKRIVVANEDAGTATILDARNGKTIATLVTGTEPEGVAISGQKAYVTGETSSTVTVIDLKSSRVVANIFVDTRPRAAVFTRNGERAYVSAEVAGKVTVLANDRVIARIALGKLDHPVGLVLSPDETRLYVATGRGNSVAVIDTKRDRKSVV